MTKTQQRWWQRNFPYALFAVIIILLIITVIIGYTPANTAPPVNTPHLSERDPVGSTGSLPLVDGASAPVTQGSLSNTSLVSR